MAAVQTLLIGAAGFLGAIARYHVEGFVSGRMRGLAVPWGTLVVNVSGCFVLGVVATLLTERFVPHPHLRGAITIGFLGAYTTFSTFAYETLKLSEDGATRLAVLNVALSIVLGIAAAWSGIVVGRAL